MIEIERAVLGGSVPPAPVPSPLPRAEQADRTEALPRMAELLQTAKRPVLVVGHSARWTLDLEALQALSTRLQAPICPTGLTTGFAGDRLDTLSLDQVHAVLAEADAVLLIGAALDWPLRQGVAIAPTTPVLELRDTPDAAPAARAADHLAIGDLGRLLRQVTDALPLRNTPPAPPRPAPAPPAMGQADLLAPSFKLSAQVLEALAQGFPARTALVVEGSTRLIQLARDIRPEQPWARFTPGLTGHLGCGPGQVLGALASGRFDQVVHVTGDFSLGLSLGDLEALVRLRLPVKILVANNSGMGSGRALSAGKHTFMVDYSPDTDYAQIMRGFGGQGHVLGDMADWPAPGAPGLRLPDPLPDRHPRRNLRLHDRRSQDPNQPRQEPSGQPAPSPTTGCRRPGPPEMGAVPLSLAQQTLLASQELHPDQAVGNIAHAWDLHGTLDPAALERALARLVARHDALRMSIRRDHGRALAEFAEQLPVSLPCTRPEGDDLATRLEAALARIQADQLTGLDLDADRLWRARLYRIDADHHLLAVSMHHLICDDWSWRILLRDLFALYQVRSARATQRSCLALPRSKPTWPRGRRAADAGPPPPTPSWPEIDWPVTEQGLPDRLALQPDTVTAQLPAGDFDRLKQVARVHNCTPFTFF